MPGSGWKALTRVRVGESRSNAWRVLLLLGTLLLLVSGCRAKHARPEGDLLYGHAPLRSVRVADPAKLTDGVVGVWGDDWRSRAAAVLPSTQAYVEYDLGQSTELVAAYLQADANDYYTLSVSDDGVHFTTLWRANPTRETGLQPRWAKNLHARGRYVRLQASGGDGRFSVTEVAVYAHAPKVFPPNFSVSRNAPPEELLRSATLVFGLALALFALLVTDKSKWWWTLLLAMAPLYAGVRWFMALEAAWPVAPREVSLVRGVVAAVAAVAVVREVFAPASWRSNRRAITGTLAVCGLLAAACFANLGRAQYTDHEHNAPGYVHNFDMRVYYPVAKYFKELRFDGLYDASVAAYAADDPNVSVDSLGYVPIRDLRSHAVVHVSDIAPRIKAIKQRFSPARWREFVADMRYFRLTMGTHDYLGSMEDHGGNATPAWFAVAHLIFSHTHASNTTLLLTGLLDPLLLTIAFIAIGRTFGLRTMLISLVVFGANDFYMFGTDWFGSTLRQDWMAYLALGVCAIKTRRYKLGGGLLGMSAMMRAFPLLALGGAAVPAGWWVWRETARRHKLPRWKDLVREHRPIVEIALSAMAVAAFMLALSSILFSPSAWVAWYHKVQILDAAPHLNHISLRGLLAGAGGNEARLLAERTPLLIAGVAGFLVLVVIAARSRPLHQAALLGLPLVPVVFNPANYYSHLVFLYPLLAVELGKGSDRRVSRRDAGIWLVWLGVCAAQYGTVLVHDVGLHFDLATMLLFAALAIMLVMLIVPVSEAASSFVPAVAGGAAAALPVTVAVPGAEPEAEVAEEPGAEVAEEPGAEVAEEPGAEVAEEPGAEVAEEPEEPEADTEESGEADAEEPEASKETDAEEPEASQETDAEEPEEAPLPPVTPRDA